MRLTQEQIEEIRKRAEAATPDEWFVMHDRDVMIESPSGSCDTHTIAYSETSTDATFIANARQDIPALLAHIAELQKTALEVLEMYEKTRRNVLDDWSEYPPAYAYLDEEVEKYRKLITGKE